jgi:hypothetical protein
MDSLLVLLIALALIGVMVVIVRRKIARDDRALLDRFAFDDDSGISPQGASYPLRFQGVGGQTSGAFTLGPGRHRLRYQFPDGVQIKVDLFTAGGDDHETLVIAAGLGEREFSVVGGRYRLDIDPAVAESRWSVALTPLQLPSQRPDSML